jgi:pre-mRNA-splicing helicase BRR2
MFQPSLAAFVHYQQVLALLKDDTLRDPERHSEIDKLVGKVTPEQFNKLIVSGRQISDFGNNGQATAEAGGEGEDGDDEKLDEEMGVAVVFDDDSEEEGDGDDDEDEVRDEEDDEGGEGGVEAMASAKLVKGVDSDDEEGADGEGGDGSTLNVKDIDAHWLQRSLSAFYGDATESATKADEVLGLLQQSDERVCENDLLVRIEDE